MGKILECRFSIPSHAEAVCHNMIKPVVVMLSEAKHLAFPATCEDEILRLRLRMTLRHNLSRGRKTTIASQRRRRQSGVHVSAHGEQHTPILVFPRRRGKKPDSTA